MLHFLRLFRLVNGQLAISLRRVKRSVICKFQCFCLFDIEQWSVSSYVLLPPSQNPPPPHSHLHPPFLKEFTLSVNCYVSVLIFHQNAKTITVSYTKILKPLQFSVFIALGVLSQGLPKIVPYWRQQTGLTKTWFLSIFLKCFSILLLF